MVLSALALQLLLQVRAAFPVVWRRALLMRLPTCHCRRERSATDALRVGPSACRYRPFPEELYGAKAAEYPLIGTRQDLVDEEVSRIGFSAISSSLPLPFAEREKQWEINRSTPQLGLRDALELHPGLSTGRG